MRIVGQRTKLTADHLLWMRIPRRFWEASFQDIQDPDVRGVVLAYLQKLDSVLDNGDGLLFWGENGVGKSCAAVVLAKEARRRGASCLFITAESLRQSVLEKEQFSDDQLVIDRARKVEFLVLDDLGKEHSGETGFTERLFENLIRERSSHRRSTVVTTNMNYEQMIKTYKHSMMEVMKESLVPVHVEGENRRDEGAGKLRARLATG